MTRANSQATKSNANRRLGPLTGAFSFAKRLLTIFTRGKNSWLGGSLLKMLFQFSEAYGVERVGEWKVFLAEFTTLQKMFCKLQVSVDSEQ